MQTPERQDFRPLFKRFMGSGYFQRKAKELRVTRETISNILGGKGDNPKILNHCLAELQREMEEQAAAIKRIQELTEIHKQLQNGVRTAG